MPGATAGPRSCPESTFPEANEASEAEANGDSIVITAAPMAPIDVTTPKPSRFIKASNIESPPTYRNRTTWVEANPVVQS
eukprot:g26317.t1